MSQLKNLLILLLLIGFSASSFASVSDVELTSCSVFSEGETSPETGDGKKPEEEEEEEEEPDCE
jgi:hypothetical protein